MFQCQQSVLLHSYRYTGKSLIIKAYTEEFGMISGIILNGFQKKQNLRSHLNPFVPAEITLKINSKGELKTIKELVSLSNTEQTDIKKELFASLLAEITMKSCAFSSSDPQLFTLIYKSACYFRNNKVNETIFALFYLLNMAVSQGILSNVMDEKNLVLGVKEGEMVHKTSAMGEVIEGPELNLFSDILGTNFAMFDPHSFPDDVQKKLLHQLLKFYSIHLPGFGKISSYQVLKEVLGD